MLVSYPPSSKLTVYGDRERSDVASSVRMKEDVAEGGREVELRVEYSRMLAWMNSANCVVSPASPEKARRLCSFSSRVLSSDDLRIVAPRMAALDEAMSVKSLPVMPRSTSLEGVRWIWYKDGK